MSLPPLIPRSILFGNPERATPLLSPNGRRLAYLAPVDGVLNVWVGSPAAEDYRPVTRDHDRGIRVYFWGRDSRHILYLQDKGGDENWRLFAVTWTRRPSANSLRILTSRSRSSSTTSISPTTS